MQPENHLLKKKKKTSSKPSSFGFQVNFQGCSLPKFVQKTRGSSPICLINGTSTSTPEPSAKAFDKLEESDPQLQAFFHVSLLYIYIYYAYKHLYIYIYSNYSVSFQSLRFLQRRFILPLPLYI